jgi:hypothetical protein
MNIVKMKIDELIEFPNNVRIHTKRNLDALKKSLEEFGQVKNIIVQKSTNYIVAGNGLYQAAKALGWEEITCNVIDIEDDKAKALCILDNRTGDLSQMDEKNLLDMLKDFDADMLDLTGYNDKELDKMLQFQEGTLFENDDKPKEKKKKKEEAISSDDQISFVLMGYPFVLADPDEIKEIKKLVDEFSNSDLEIRCETTFKVFEVIKQALKEAVEVNPDDMEIETDRM